MLDHRFLSFFEQRDCRIYFLFIRHGNEIDIFSFFLFVFIWLIHVNPHFAFYFLPPMITLSGLFKITWILNGVECGQKRYFSSPCRRCRRQLMKVSIWKSMIKYARNWGNFFPRKTVSLIGISYAISLYHFLSHKTRSKRMPVFVLTISTIRYCYIETSKLHSFSEFWQWNGMQWLLSRNKNQINSFCLLRITGRWLRCSIHKVNNWNLSANIKFIIWVELETLGKPQWPSLFKERFLTTAKWRMFTWKRI